MAKPKCCHAYAPATNIPRKCIVQF